MRTQPSSRVRILAPGVGEVEASLIVEEGTELIVMLRDAEAFVESHSLDISQYFCADSLPVTVLFSPAQRKMAHIAS